jgi:cobalt-zinc-cadmium efflux system outer membrane protein
VSLLRFEAQRREGAALITLATLLGLDPNATVELPSDGAFSSPTQTVEQLTAHARAIRGEVAAAEMERQVFENQVRLLRRSRIPNLTLSAFVARDEFDQQLYGGGLSFPFPLPAPLGHTNKGEIAETRARIEQAENTSEQVKRRVRLEVAQAFLQERSRAEALRAFAPDLLTRAHGDLAALREGLSSHQLSVRDALLAQRSLVELLLARVDTQLAYANAAVELRRAAGIPLGGAL